MQSSLNKRKLQRTKRFARDIKNLSRSIQEEAFSIAQKLSQDVFEPTLNIRSMKGFKDVYRVVVMKSYRMIFSFDSENIYLLRIAHRRDIYRKLEL